MTKRLFSVFVALIMAFCLSSADFAGVKVFAEEETYLEITSSSKVLESGTYQLTSDVKLSNFLQINSGVEVTLDLNGYNLTGSGTSVVLIYGGTFTLIDSSTDGTGSIQNTSSSTSSYGVRLSNGGTFNVYGGTISGSYGIYANSGECIINITSGIIKGTKSAAIYYKAGSTGSFTVSGTDTVIISSSGTSTDSYGFYSTGASISVSNPNTYISTTSSTAASVKTISYSKSAITAGHYSTDVTNYVPDGYTCNETDDSDYPYVVTADVVLPEFYGKTLTLDGSVGVTFYFDMTGVSDPGTYSLTAKTGDDGEEQSITAGEVKTLSDGIEYYRYTVYVKPDEFSTTIYASLTDGTNTTEIYEYSAYDYCMYAIENDWEESELCKALLNYGDYACAYDSGMSSCSLDGIDGWIDPVTEEWSVDLSEYSGTETAGVAKTILLGSTVAIRLYLTSDVADEGDIFTVNGDALELKSVDDQNYAYYIEFKVSAKDMTKTFTVLKNGEKFTTYSVLSYVKNTVESPSSDASLSNLCKAIYYYSLAACEYEGWQ